MRRSRSAARSRGSPARPASSTSIVSESSARVSPVISTGSPVSRVFASTRDARLTASPITLKESRPAPPIEPATTVPGVDADADLEAAGPAAVDRAGDLDRALDGAVGVVVAPGRERRRRRAAASPMNWSTWPRWRATIGTTHSNSSLRRETTSDAWPRAAAAVKSLHVAEDQRDLDLVTARLEVLADQVARDLLVQVGAEGLAQPLALAEPVDHLVERRGELAELVRGGDRDVLVEAALADPLGRGLEVLDRPQDRAR